jgi:hypothetical protein
MRARTLRISLVLTAAATAALVSGAAAGQAKPAFASYAAPRGMGDDAGEPSLGVDLRTGAVLFEAGKETLRASAFDGRGGATWRTVTPLLPGLYTLDPILETDTRTGRTYASSLDLYCSRLAYTDDDGAHWTQVPLGCGLGAAFDHQTVGVAPMRAKHDRDAYPEVVYYCAQTTVTTNCGTSKDGGHTFGVATVAYTVKDCDTATGHVEGAPDGTAYLPAWICNGRAGVAVTTDDGATWTLRIVPGSAVGDAMHPGLGVANDGTVYFAWGGMVSGGPGGPPFVSVSRNRGAKWTAPLQLGADVGVRNTRFVTVVAGDGDRAAVAYLGTRTGGDGSAVGFAGRWDLYVSFTYDRGRHWTTVDATPASPVQVGPICTSGALCSKDRNLLDFEDLVIDKQGRVLAAVADGCLAATCTTANRASKATIVRQESGRGLLRKYDGRT